MTTPAEPATGAGAPGTGVQSADPQEPAGQEPATGTDAGTDWATAFEGMTPEEVKTQLDHARTWEKRAKANKAALDKANAAKGQQPSTKGDGPTLEELQQQLEEEREGRESAETRAVELAYRDTVTRAAREAGADAEALLDSDSFRDAVGEELDEDFDDDDLAKAVAKVAKEFAKKPRFAAGQRPPARSGADITGGPGALRQVTEDELARMSPEQIVAAQEKGQLNSLLGIT